MFVRLIREGRCGKSRRLSHLGSFYGADLFFVYNHLHTVHAIAACNAAEVAMGMLTEGSAGFELVVPVTVTDRSGTEVMHADITTWVTPNTRRD